MSLLVPAPWWTQPWVAGRAPGWWGNIIFCTSKLGTSDLMYIYSWVNQTWGLPRTPMCPFFFENFAVLFTGSCLPFYFGLIVPAVSLCLWELSLQKQLVDDHGLGYQGI